MPFAYIGIDDTDNHESRGTGHLARAIADQLEAEYPVFGVVRHQLFFDPRVPFTSHNSSASIIFEVTGKENFSELFDQVKSIMQSDFQPGSDPGLCLAVKIPEAITAFGIKAKTDLVTQSEARSLAGQAGIMLEGLGGTQDGVIGALAAVGLSCGGFDGRYVRIGSLRKLQGIQTILAILASGVNEIQTVDDTIISEGNVLSDKLRPSRRNHNVILYVEKHEDNLWHPLKLD